MHEPIHEHLELPADIQALLDALVAGVRHSLGPNLAGVYLRGSLVLGDFIPATSDVDVLVATHRPLDAAAFDHLTLLHAQMAALSNPYANRLEIAYIDRAALRRFEPGRRHVTLGQGETLAWSEHYTNWILERWAVREHGATLLGPSPDTLIDPVSHSALMAAVCDRLRDWAEWARNDDDYFEWHLPLSHKAYVVETMCRALYAQRCGALASKPQAVAWAVRTLPEPYHTTAARAQAWRTDNTLDPSAIAAAIDEVRRFVLWTAAACQDQNRVADTM